MISEKWRVLLLLALAELLAMATWFSASAVVPALTQAWELTASGQAWLTMSVQIGFVVGAVASAMANAADRLPARWLFAVSAVGAGLATLLIPLVAKGLALALVLRFATGFLLAGVYPIGMKIAATWTRADRGFAIGMLVGALTLGSAAPHLINVFGGVRAWQPVLLVAGASAVGGGLLGSIFVQEGPYRAASPPFSLRQVGLILRERPVLLANMGYLGHMWELYAMWAWLPLFLLASFAEVGVDPRWASAVAFAAVGIGGLGSLIAGQLADKLGRTTITMASLLVSGICALTIGLFFGGSAALVSAVALLWGFAIVADSAQFSAAVSELSAPEWVGTSLTLQTSLGFLLTLFSIRMVPTLVEWVTWRWAFAFLALGPLVGIWAMARLRQSPDATKLANGNR